MNWLVVPVDTLSPIKPTISIPTFLRFDLCLTIARSTGAGTETKQLWLCLLSYALSLLCLYSAKPTITFGLQSPKSYHSRRRLEKESACYRLCHIMFISSFLLPIWTVIFSSVDFFSSPLPILKLIVTIFLNLCVAWALGPIQHNLFKWQS